MTDRQNGPLVRVLEDLDCLSDEGVDYVQVPPDVSVGDTVGHVTLDQNLNLNAIAIGLGLEKIEYEPEQFPGLVYRLESATVFLFGDGTLLCPDAGDKLEVRDAIETTTNRLADLGLFDEGTLPEVSLHSGGKWQDRDSAADITDTTDEPPSGDQETAPSASTLRDRADRDPSAVRSELDLLLEYLDSDDLTECEDAAAALVAVARNHPDVLESVFPVVVDRLLDDEETSAIAEQCLRNIRDLHEQGVQRTTIAGGIETALGAARERIRKVAADTGGDVVPTGGATIVEAAQAVRDAASATGGREQLVVEGVAGAIERPAVVVADRAGIDPIDALVELRTAHDTGDTGVGITPDGDVSTAVTTVPTSEVIGRVVRGIRGALLVWYVRGTVSQLEAVLDVHTGSEADSRNPVAVSDETDPDVGGSETGESSGNGGEGTTGPGDAQVDALVEQLDAEVDTRREAGGELARRAREEPTEVDAATDALIGCLDDDDPAVRKHACEALGHLGAERALAALRDARLDSNTEVSEAARTAIRRIED